jgi:hypothetical protein
MDIINNNVNNKTKEECQAEIKPIIVKLRELKLTIQSHTEIKELFIQMQRYINEGVKVELDIPFPAYNCCIKGVLSIKRGEKVWVKLESTK